MFSAETTSHKFHLNITRDKERKIKKRIEIMTDRQIDKQKTKHSEQVLHFMGFFKNRNSDNYKKIDFS